MAARPSSTARRAPVNAAKHPDEGKAEKSAHEVAVVRLATLSHDCFEEMGGIVESSLQERGHAAERHGHELVVERIRLGCGHRLLDQASGLLGIRLEPPEQHEERERHKDHRKTGRASEW